MGPAGACPVSNSLSLCPTCTIVSIAGISSLPISVSEYSTEGGDVDFSWRLMTALDSRTRSRLVRTLAEIGVRSSRSSLNRLGPALKLQMTFGVHAPPMTAMQWDSAQGGGGSGLLLFL